MKFKAPLHYLNRRDHRLLPKNFNSTKIIFVLAVCLTIIFSVKIVFAATTTQTTTITLPSNELSTQISDKQTSLEDENLNSEVWKKEDLVTTNLLGVNILSGTNINAAFQGDTSWVPQGFIGYTSDAIASLYKPPASGVQYIADSVNGFLGKPVYADDGFNQLKGLQPLWKLCRNTVYTLVSIVFVAIGLMIMLRIKISPQATITIQNSIPKIITTLILVTFSYAISGLIIDISYLFQAIILSLINSVDTARTGILSNVPQLNELIQGGWNNFEVLGRHNMWQEINLSVPGIATTAITTIVGGIIGALAAPGGTAVIVLGILGAIVGALIILIFIFWQLIKFFFGCAKAYIILLLKIISAPLEIALGAFPNSKIGFNTWFIQTISYAAVFPICLIFLVLLNVIMNAISLNEVWTPGVLQGGILSIVLRPLIGLVGITLLPKLPDLIPQIISQSKASPFGKAIGEGMAPVAAFAKFGPKAVSSGVRSGISTNIIRGGNGTGNNQLINWWVNRGGKAPAPGAAPEAKAEEGTGTTAREKSKAGILP